MVSRLIRTAMQSAGRVEMPAGTSTICCAAIAKLMNMKTVKPGGQAIHLSHYPQLLASSGKGDKAHHIAPVGWHQYQFNPLHSIADNAPCTTGQRAKHQGKNELLHF